MILGSSSCEATSIILKATAGASCSAIACVGNCVALSAWRCWLCLWVRCCWGWSRLIQTLAGHTPGRVNLWVVLGLAVLGPVLYITARLARTYYRYHPRRVSALALFDEELKTHDRLVTADEFMGYSPREDERTQAFKQAAVADADGYARSALSAALSPMSLPQWHVRPMSWLGVPATALVIALLYWNVGVQKLPGTDNQ